MLINLFALIIRFGLATEAFEAASASEGLQATLWDDKYALAAAERATEAAQILVEDATERIRRWEDNCYWIGEGMPEMCVDMDTYRVTGS